MKIKIKQALLEGYTPEVIVEAVHTNHPRLDKRLLKDPTTSYADGKAIENNRNRLATEIKDIRGLRDYARKDYHSQNIANKEDNRSRGLSQSGNLVTNHDINEIKNISKNKVGKVVEAVPRLISSAKK